MFKELFEKSYRMQGTYSTKTPIGGKVLQAFKKKTEKFKYSDEGLIGLNKEWSKFSKTEARKIIESEVKKRTGNNALGVNATLEKVKWISTYKIGDTSELFGLDEDFVINVTFADDIDSSRYQKKLGGILNPQVPYRVTNVFGDDSMDLQQNIEIRDNFVLNLDNK